MVGLRKAEIVSRHHAKVYGLSPGAAPTMAVPHLDSRVLEGKRALLFGPYAAWTTKFLHGGGSFWDLPGSLRWHNLLTLLKVGVANLPLVGYLVQQGLQSMNARMRELANFYPDAKAEDWKLIDAGIRVQAIKKEDGDAGIVHFGTGSGDERRPFDLPPFSVLPRSFGVREHRFGSGPQVFCRLVRSIRNTGSSAGNDSHARSESCGNEGRRGNDSKISRLESIRGAGVGAYS